MAKISVIIPIYNVKPHIEKCVISLYEQTLSDIEYIFVDDASSDGSIDVLKRVMELYPDRKRQSVVIKHDENRGVAQARRTGVEAASGEYIIHCDSDDWVDTKLYQEMYEKARITGADIVVCQYAVISHDCVTIRKGTQITDVNGFMKSMLFYEDSFAIWNKLVRRSLYRGVRFPEYNMGDDMAIMFQLFKNATSIKKVCGVYYYYNGLTDSITRRMSKEVIIQRTKEACENAIIATSALDDNSGVFKDGIIHLKYKQRIHLMPIINDRDAYEIWKNIFPEINLEIMFNPNVKIKLIDRLKFLATLLGIFPIVKKCFRSNIV